MKKIIYSIYIALQLLAFVGCEEKSPTIKSGYTQYGTPFLSMPATSDVVIYEVNMRAFSSTGTFQGVINRLDELKALGINVIWLMPIHPIGQIKSVNSPYSVQDYKAVSPEYGTLNDLRTLTTEAHNRDMAVIIDWIANHTAWDNEWIENKSWYTQNVAGDIIHPSGTNWLDVADLNFSNADMRLAMIDAMKYWVLEANIDGFRCDYADGVPSTFWKQAIDSLRNIPNREIIMLAEGARSNHYTVGFDLMYAWNYYYKLKDIFNGETATSLYTTHVNEYASVPNGKHRLRYTTNHDESAWEDTPITYFKGINGALAASVTAIFMEGVPLFYTGQEVGRATKLPFFSKSPINWNENADMLQAYKEMMAVYTHSEAARRGTLSNFSQTNVVCFKKTTATEQVLVIVNVRNQNTTFTLPTSLQSTEWTNTLSHQPIQLETSISLDPYAYYILQQLSETNK
jgi:glycosidase